MKRKLNIYHALCIIITTILFLCGCSNNNGTANSQNGKNGVEIKEEEISYISQPILQAEYESFAAYSNGDDLHYIATEYNQDSQQYETAFYTLKQESDKAEINFSLAKNQTVTKMTLDADNNIYYLAYEEPSQDSKNNQSSSNLTLYKVDFEGNILLELDLNEYTRGQEQSIIGGLAVDGENRIMLFDSNQTIYVFDSEGNILFNTRADGTISAMCNSNGKVFIIYTAMNGAEIKEVDTSNKKLSSKFECNISGNQIYMTSSSNGSLLIATDKSVYKYNPEADELIRKFDWQTYDVTGISSGILLPYGENGVLAISRNYAAVPMQVEATALKESISGEIIAGETTSKEKTIITIGVPHFMPSGLNTEIVAFNKANPDYKIEVKYYENNYTLLNTELITGNGPDLLMLPSSRINQLPQGGIIEDLNPYFDADTTLNRDDFLENILTAFGTDGHLYWMPLGFNIFTMIGETSILGESASWDLDEFIAFSESFPKETDVFDTTSKSSVLDMLKYAYMNQLVDMNNTTTPLNRDLLTKMLTFANQYENDEQSTPITNLSEKIENEQILLLGTLIYSGNANYGYSQLFGGPITYIGYPTEAGNGNLITSDCTFAINSGSEHKDIAWNFISMLLSEESQKRMEKDYSTKGFHIRKDALESHFESCLEKGGGFVYGIFFNRTKELFTYNDNTTTQINEENIEPIRKLIESVDTILFMYPDIDEIIKEEAAFYFNGTKPIEEVVTIIENRVRTYVNESK